MRKAPFCIVLLAAGIFLLGMLPAVAAPSYTCKKLPALAGYPSNINISSCINNSGQVSGNNQGAHHAFLYTKSNNAIQDLGTLPEPYTAYSYGYGINDAGQVVGRSDSLSYGYYHPFLYTPGSPPTMQDLVGLPGFTDACSANGINNAGQVAGTSKTLPSAYTRAFLYTPGSPPTMQDLGGLNETIISSANGINNAGRVVGSSFYNFGPHGVIYHAFLWSSGTGMQDLGTLPAPYDNGSRGNAINAAGQVVGTSSSYGPTISRSFLYTPGSPPTMQDLGTLPAPYDYDSYAAGINTAGQVVGYCRNSSSSSYHAWLYSGGVMLDLNSLVVNLPAGEVLGMAYGINDRGQIAANGNNGAYLLSPVSASAGVDLLLLN
jgi:probable HAF family extracellular repeat protein